MPALLPVINRRFPPCPQSVAAARSAARTALDGRPSQLVEDAVLMVSELASNCVRHARTDYELRIDTDGDVRVEVQDQSGEELKILSPALRQASGRGLPLVDALSDSWGVSHQHGGKIVWFRLRPDALA